jgi:hypothetical protein
MALPEVAKRMKEEDAKTEENQNAKPENESC